MPTGHFFYCNINQGLGKIPFWQPHTPTFKTIDKLVELMLAAPRPRILGLSEVMKREWNTGTDLYERIKKAAQFPHGAYARGLHAEYLPKLRTKFPVQFDSGNALLSDLPIEEQTEGVFLPRNIISKTVSQLIGKRSFLMAKLRHDHGSLYMIVSHFTCVFRGERDNACKVVTQIGSRITGPAVLMFDANSLPRYVPASKRYLDRGPDGLRDDYRRDRTLEHMGRVFEDTCPVNAMLPSCNQDSARYATFEERIIDYILTKGMPVPSAYRVRPELVSDHRMIECHMELPQQEAHAEDIAKIIRKQDSTTPHQIKNGIALLQESARHIAAALPDTGREAWQYVKEKGTGFLKKVFSDDAPF